MSLKINSILIRLRNQKELLYWFNYLYQSKKDPIFEIKSVKISKKNKKNLKVVNRISFSGWKVYHLENYKN